jgi:outer membrane usher protein
MNELIYGAKSVWVQLLSAVDQKNLGQTIAIPIFTDGAEHVFNMIARMYTPNGRVTAGSGLYGHFQCAYK